MKSRSGSSNNVRAGFLALDCVPVSLVGLALCITIGIWTATPGFCAEGVGLSGDVGDVGDVGVVDAVDASPNPTSFAELLEGFAEMSGLEARFEEEKFLALLAAPLRSQGRLYFEPPATLLRRVESPVRQDILIRANRVRISTAGSVGDGDPSGVEVQTIDLTARGGIRPLVESLIWIFTGDRVSLERVYHIEYQRFSREVGEDADRADAGDPSQPWQVRLTPRATPLSSLIRELRVRGRGRSADRMELVETSGDRTITKLLDANPRRAFSPAERLELFGSAD